MGLLLEAVDVAGPSRWRWLLTDEKTGSRLAGHRVELDPGSDEVARFRDLYGYARWRAAPDRRFEDEARIVHAAGGWAGAELLGESVGAAIAARAPVTVRVVIPAPAEPVLLWPLELAHVAGSPLAARGDVALVYDIAPDRPGQLKDPVAETLRILAVFSLPTGTAVAAIRRERYALSQLIRRIAARDGGAVELRVVQYGVTRQRLKQIADSADGWDVLHLSGHGGRGLFALEHADGTPDHVSGADLAELLRPARRRAKLAMVWACRSAADGTAETRRPAGLAGHAEAEAGHAEQVPGLARALVRELDCAVVAMRYLVTSEFTSAFAEAFYEHLLSGRQPVDAAAARVLAELAAPGPTAVSAVSLATPGVFGSRAAGLTLVAPPRRPRPDLASRRMAYLPDEPARFVGRAAAMARASAALAPDSGKTAVLLCGMAGTGKTACALELAHRYRDGFAAAAFWRAPARVPARGDERAGALADLADTLATQLADYGFTGTAGLEKLVPRTRAAKLERFLSRLRQGLRDSRVLLVLDNLETLLTPEGTWSDPRLGRLITGLTGHEGGSRLILTSRVAPTGLGAGVLTLPIPELLPGEAAELARELPNLRRLLHVDWEPAEAQAGEEADWERYRRVRRVVRGHPRLLELADAGAADRNQLDARLAAADAAPAGQQLTSFLLHAPALDAAGFLNVFTTWAAAALAALPPPTRLMAEFLACLEDGDRKRTVVDQNWTDLWRRLARPGDPADPGTQLDALIAATLIQPGPHGDPVSYLMHPAVCTAIRDAVAPGVREAADIGLAAFWKAAAYQALNRDGGEDSETVVSTGLAAAPYLLRRREWDVAASLLGKVIARDRSYETLQAALPALRSIVEPRAPLLIRQSWPASWRPRTCQNPSGSCVMWPGSPLETGTTSSLPPPPETWSSC